MKSRPLYLELLVLAALIALGAGVRIVVGPELPNFAPIAAISLLGLALLGRRLWRVRFETMNSAEGASSRNPAVT